MYALVRAKVEVTVAAEVERDDLPVSRHLAAERLVDDDPDRVGRLGRRQEPFGRARTVSAASKVGFWWTATASMTLWS